MFRLIFKLWIFIDQRNIYRCVPLLVIDKYAFFQLRESFKDLKKKFNNLKFNYTKKTEKARNLKVLKIQIQQVDMYAEKMQVIVIVEML